MTTVELIVRAREAFCTSEVSVYVNNRTTGEFRQIQPMLDALLDAVPVLEEAAFSENYDAQKAVDALHRIEAAIREAVGERA